MIHSRTRGSLVHEYFDALEPHFLLSSIPSDALAQQSRKQVATIDGAFSRMNEKFHYTFILWHHEFILRLLCYYCHLYELYGDDVQGLFCQTQQTQPFRGKNMLEKGESVRGVLEFTCDNNL